MSLQHIGGFLSHLTFCEGTNASWCVETSTPLESNALKASIRLPSSDTPAYSLRNDQVRLGAEDTSMNAFAGVSGRTRIITLVCRECVPPARVGNRITQVMIGQKSAIFLRKPRQRSRCFA